MIYTLYFHPLARIPGPKWWIISRIPYFRSITTGQFIHSVRALHERYGPVVRLAANEVSFTDPQAWQDIYGHHGGERAFPRNPVWYQPALNACTTSCLQATATMPASAICSRTPFPSGRSSPRSP